jgi:hypothetical protein
MSSDNHPRVFLGLRETAGYYQRLQTGFEEIGVRCTYADLSGNPHRYERRRRWWSFAAMALARKHRSANRAPERALWRALQLALSVAVVVWAIPQHDAFIVGSPQASLVRVAYPLLRWLRKDVVSVLHGSESRPPYLNAKFAGEDGPPDVRRLSEMAKTIRSDLRRIERWSSVVISHPPSSQFLNADFVDFLTVGIPVEAAPTGRAERSGSLRVLHAPSHPNAKGTALIREAISSCIAAGADLEYVELSGKSNREVLAAIPTVHLAVDQAFSDQPMASFAAEASSYGIPVVVGCCDWQAALHNIADPPPTVRCAPDEIGETVAKIAADPDWRLRAGTDAQAYVVSRWEPAAVATRYLKLIEGDTPADWLRSPRAISYAWGAGLSQERVQEVVAAIVRADGEDALLLSDRPKVRKQLLAREA